MCGTPLPAKIDKTFVRGEAFKYFLKLSICGHKRFSPPVIMESVTILLGGYARTRLPPWCGSELQKAAGRHVHTLVGCQSSKTNQPNAEWSWIDWCCNWVNQNLKLWNFVFKIITFPPFCHWFCFGRLSLCQFLHMIILNSDILSISNGATLPIHIP